MSGGDVWESGEHLERLAALAPNRRSLVKGYARRYLEADLARRRQKRVGRKLTDVEERIGAALALDELLGRSRSKGSE